MIWGVTSDTRKKPVYFCFCVKDSNIIVFLQWFHGCHFGPRRVQLLPEKSFECNAQINFKPKCDSNFLNFIHSPTILIAIIGQSPSVNVCSYALRIQCFKFQQDNNNWTSRGLNWTNVIACLKMIPELIQIRINYEDKSRLCVI